MDGQRSVDWWAGVVVEDRVWWRMPSVSLPVHEGRRARIAVEVAHWRPWVRTMWSLETKAVRFMRWTHTAGQTLPIEHIRERREVPVYAHMLAVLFLSLTGVARPGDGGLIPWVWVDGRREV